MQQGQMQKRNNQGQTIEWLISFQMSPSLRLIFVGQPCPLAFCRAQLRTWLSRSNIATPYDNNRSLSVIVRQTETA